MLELAQPLALRARVHEQQRRAAQDLRVELLLARRVGADRRDVRPGRTSADRSSGASRGRRGHDQRARPATSAGESAATREAAGQPNADLPRTFGGALGVASPDLDFGKRQDFGVELGLKPCLDSRPQDPEDGVPAAELARDHRRHGGGAQIRQVAAVVEVGDRLAGLGRDEDDRAVRARGRTSRRSSARTARRPGGSST